MQPDRSAAADAWLAAPARDLRAAEHLRDGEPALEFHQGLVAVKGTTARTLEEVSASFRALLGAEIV